MGKLTKVAFSKALQLPNMQKLINNAIRNPEKRERFCTAIVAAVGTNMALQNCNATSIIQCALTGEALGLSPSPVLGQYYMIPFDRKEKKDGNGNVIQEADTIATFVLGYKGMIALAVRTGMYKHINAFPVKAGELISWNPLTEELDISVYGDENKREKLETIGYVARFQMLNGFEKTLFWTKSKMMGHADKYSKAFSADAYEKLIAGKIPAKELWKYSSFWYKDFDEMALKTLLRQLFTRWGALDASLEKALTTDNQALDRDGNLFDTDEPEIPVIPENTGEPEIPDTLENQTIMPNQEPQGAEELRFDEI